MSASVKAVCVDPKQVHLIWDCVSHWIRLALERGDLGTFSVLENDVLCGQALLWLAWDEPKIAGTAVTQIVRTERSKVCKVMACGGERIGDWVHLLTDIEKFARDERCDCVRLSGRRGWERMLPNYRATKIVLERRL